MISTVLVIQEKIVYLCISSRPIPTSAVTLVMLKSFPTLTFCVYCAVSVSALNKLYLPSMLIEIDEHAHRNKY